MTSFIFCLVFGLYLDLGCLQEQHKACEVGDFCEYTCHCLNKCQGDLKCAGDDICRRGWFGYRCQYKDLANLNTKVTTEPYIHNLIWLTDQNDKTCNTQKYLKSITVTWRDPKPIPLTWTRITVNDSETLSNMTLQFNIEGITDMSSCLNETFAEINSKTLDRRCNDDVLITSLTLSGNLSSLCSFYISGGRNVAYNQSAIQSSELEHKGKANLAVDGITNNVLSGGSCAHTEQEMSPSWNLTLQSHYVIKRLILYNRGDANRERLKGFFINTYSWIKQIGFYNDRSGSDKTLIYYVNLNGSVNTAVNFISISLKGEGFLVLCEVEAYGECPLGYWSLPCTKRCPPSCSNNCDRDTGDCNTVCNGYSNPPQCNAACSSGKWGINCRQACSDTCEGRCNTKTGLCDQGCKGYSDPPYCKTACYPIKWGTNCSLRCSDYCHKATCNPFSGNCDHGCKLEFQKADCTEEKKKILNYY